MYHDCIYNGQALVRLRGYFPPSFTREVHRSTYNNNNVIVISSSSSSRSRFSYTINYYYHIILHYDTMTML